MSSPLKSILLPLLVLLSACGVETAPDLSLKEVPDAGASSSAPLIRVTGTIVGGFDGVPIDHPVQVLIGDRPAVTSGTDGSFEAGEVARPYDVTVVDAARGIVITYQGLERTTPTLMIPEVAVAQESEAWIGARVLGGDASFETAVIADLPALWSQRAEGSDGEHGNSFYWPGTTQTTARLAALQFQRAADGTPAQFASAAFRDVSVYDGAEVENVSLALEPIGQRRVSGTTSLPSGYTLHSRSLRVTFGHADVRFQEREAAAPEFSYLVPDSDRFVSILGGYASDGQSATTAYVRAPDADGKSVSLVFAAPPTLLAPEPGAEVIAGVTRFEWTPVEGGVHVLELAPPEEGTRFYVVTAATSATLGDFSAQGVVPQPGARYTWRVVGFAPLSPDRAASLGFVKQWNDLVETSFQRVDSARRSGIAR